MDHREGEPAGATLTCDEGVATRLRCAGCGKPICPSCFVRTEVGLKCGPCAAPVPAARALASPPKWVPVAALVAVLAVAGGTWGLLNRPGTEPAEVADDLGSDTTVTAAPQVVAEGTLPDGPDWQLRALSNERGEICAELSFVRGASGPLERCTAVAVAQPFGLIMRGTVERGSRASVTWGAVSDQAEAVRVSLPDGSNFEVPTVAREAALGVRFFVVSAAGEGAITLVALTAGGQELGRANLPPLPIR